jgi:hypothetical protein
MEREAPRAIRREVELGRDYSVVVAGHGVVGRCRVRSCNDLVMVLELSDELANPSNARLRPIFHTAADGVMRLQSISMA